MDNNFTEQQSLAVINDMISRARGRVEKGDGKHLLLWGYVVAAASLAHFIAILSTPQSGPMAGIIWAAATLLGIVVTVIFGIRDRKRQQVTTYSDTISWSIWGGFLAGAFVIGFLLASTKMVGFLYPAISLLYVYAAFMSAVTYKFKWMFSLIGLCVVCLFLYSFLPSTYWPLIHAGIMVLGNIVPGHIVNCKGRRNV